MPDALAKYFDAMDRASAEGRLVRDMVAKLSAALPALDQWVTAHVPHEPWRGTASEDPFEALHAWPDFDQARDAFDRHRSAVREMDATYRALSPEERMVVSDPTLRPRKPVHVTVRARWSSRDRRR